MSAMYEPVLNPPSPPSPFPLLSNHSAQRLRKSKGQNVTAVVKGDTEQRGFRGDRAWGEREGRTALTALKAERRDCRKGGKIDSCVCT